MVMKVLIFISCLVFLIAFSLIGLGICSTVIESNPISNTNSTITGDYCENNIRSVLRGWGISAVVIGSLFFIWGVIQIFLVYFYDVQSDRILSMNIPLAFVAALIFALGAAFIGDVIFRAGCVGQIRYYYWSISCATFCISIVYLGSAFLVCVGWMCAVYME